MTPERAARLRTIFAENVSRWKIGRMYCLNALDETSADRVAITGDKYPAQIGLLIFSISTTTGEITCEGIVVGLMMHEVRRWIELPAS